MKERGGQVEMEVRLHCFECGDRVTIRTEKEQREYDSSGMCVECRNEAIGEMYNEPNC